MLINDIMVRDVVTLREEETLEQATILLQRGSFRHLPIVAPLHQAEEPRPKRIRYPPPKLPVAVMGILSDRDLPGGRVGAVPLEQLHERQAREVMRRPVITASPRPEDYLRFLRLSWSAGFRPAISASSISRSARVP